MRQKFAYPSVSLFFCQQLGFLMFIGPTSSTHLPSRTLKMLISPRNLYLQCLLTLEGELQTFASIFAERQLKSFCQLRSFL